MIEYFKLLTKQTILYGVGHGASQLSSFLLLPIYARYLSKEHFGVLALLIVFYGMVILYILGKSFYSDNVIITVFGKIFVLSLFPLFLYMTMFYDDKETLVIKKLISRLKCRYILG